MNRRLLTAATFSVVAALTLLWYKTQSVDSQEHDRFDTALRELRRLDRTLNQDTLRARFQLINTYDPLVETTAKINGLRPVLANPPSFVSGEHRAALEGELSAYADLLSQKQEEIERFKSRNAVLKNSLRYLPTLGGELATYEEATGSPEQARLLRSILEDVLVYNVTSDQTYPERITAALVALAASSDLEESQRLALFAQHTETVLTMKGEVEQLLRTIFSTPISAAEERVANQYAYAYASAERSAGRYRAVMYALSVLLLGLVVFAFIRLRSALTALANANHGLEQKVRDRTAALGERNLAMRLVLDHVAQGFVTAKKDGVLSQERSAAITRWFGEHPQGTTLWELIRPMNERASELLRVGYPDIFEDNMPPEIVAELLRSAFQHNDRHFEIELRPIMAGALVDSVLIMIHDVTSRIAQERSEAEGQEMVRLVRHITQDPQGLRDYLQEAEGLVNLICHPAKQEDQRELLRALHTLKGSSALMGVQGIPQLAHQLESKHEEQGALEPSDQESLQQAWRALQTRISSLGELKSEGIVISHAEFAQLQEAIKAGNQKSELLPSLSRLQNEPASRRFARLAEQARALSQRLGKGAIEVISMPCGVRFEPARWAPFWSVFSHALRNAIDHGLESPEERLCAGKPAQGVITLRSYETREEILLDLEDDGRGIDWGAVKRRATALGVAANTEQELQEALFADGLSTAEQLTELSGRGVGMSAVRQVVSQMGGRILISSTPGRGTKLTFRFPNRLRAAA